LPNELLSAPPPDPTDGALFFHDAAIEPPWPERERTAEIGAHIFYR
jgi:spore germination cell wall hydrolase CwlJ-like protein